MRLHCLPLLALGIQGNDLQIPTLKEMITADFEVVSKALVRSGDIDFPLDALETNGRKFIWITHGTLRDTLSQCTSLNLSRMGLKRLPMYAIALMSNLKTLNISWNRGLVISEEDLECLGKTVETVIFNNLDVNAESVRRLLRLPLLTSLNLSGNDLSGMVDVLEGGAERLEELYLDDCKLRRSVFVKIRRFKRLRILDVSNNRSIRQKMTSEFDFGNLKETLVELSINDSKVELDELKAICSLKKLQRLSIDYNPRIGQEMTRRFDFGGLKDTLVELNLRNSDVGPGGLIAISKCKGISKLLLSWNSEIGKGLDGDFNLGYLAGSLESLDMHACGLTAEGLKALRRCTKLQKLEISWNTGMGAEMEEDLDLDKLKNTLVDLDVTATGLTAPGLRSIGQCTKLEKLNISYNAEVFEGINGLTLGQAKDTLRDLRARCTEMGMDGLRLVCQCTKLEKLYIGENPRIGSSPTEGFSFGALEQTLVELDMYKVDITEDIFGALCRCTGLTKLNANSNSKVGGYIARLGLGSLLNTVEDLDLYDVGLGVEGLRRVCECTKLKTLDISGNIQLSATLNTEFDFGRLTHSLMKLDLEGDSGDEIMRTVFRKRGMAQVKALSPSGR